MAEVGTAKEQQSHHLKRDLGNHEGRSSDKQTVTPQRHSALRMLLLTGGQN